jgi:hypothetical protein
MPRPFLIESAKPAPRLFQAAGGRFQLVEAGALSPFMAGPGYLLVEARLAYFLNELDLKGVQFEEVVVYDPLSKEELTTHVRVTVGQVLAWEQIKDLNLLGLHLLAMNDEHYFASPELKAKLESSSFSYLRFSEGLNGFAAGAA